MKRLRTSEDEIYEEACQEVDELVENVIDQIHDVANACNYEPAWVIERFRDRFNQKVRKELDG